MNAYRAARPATKYRRAFQRVVIPGSEMPKVELRPGKKDSLKFNLYINGKTDGVQYVDDNGTKTAKGHKEKFKDILLSIPCKCFPNNCCTALYSKTSFTTGILPAERTIWLLKQKNVFSLTLYYDIHSDIIHPYLTIDGKHVISLIKKAIKINKGIKLKIEKNERALIVVMKGHPYETIQQAMNRMIGEFEWMQEIAKNMLLSDLAHFIYSIKRNDVKWG